MEEYKGSRSLLNYINTYFGEFLNNEKITEICFNGFGDLRVLYDGHEWKCHTTKLSFKSASAIASAVASEKEVTFDKKKSILSSSLPNGERIHIVGYPATKKEYISITIRKPSNRKITMQEYEEQGLFDISKNYEIKKENNQKLKALYENEKWKKFIIEAIKQHKTIIVSGATGSGKTTLMKTLMNYIPNSLRIISIEDTEELIFDEENNYVQLFYPSEAIATDFLNATSLLKSCLRMKPDVIVVAELRGSETFDFVNAISSGHGGSITSCHAGSVTETFNRLAMMMLRNESAQKIPFEVIRDTLRETIDIVIHMEDTDTGKRITEMYFKNIDFNKKRKNDD